MVNLSGMDSGVPRSTVGSQGGVAQEEGADNLTAAREAEESSLQSYGNPNLEMVEVKICRVDRSESRAMRSRYVGLRYSLVPLFSVVLGLVVGELLG